MSSMKKCFLLLGIFCFIISALLFSKHHELRPYSEPTAGGDDRVDWTIISAAQPEEDEDEPAESSCSLRRLVRNDVFLADKFRFSVPVLQWTRTFSKPAWAELRARAPPYGWKGLPVDVVRSALSFLNDSRLFRRVSPDSCVRCAVVGNGGILRGSRQGNVIDSHDFVFRMNGAVIRGFEDDVGTKISFYGFTTNTMKNALVMYRRDGFTRIPQSPEITYIFIPSDVRDYAMMAAAVRRRPVASGEDRGDRPWMYFGDSPPENFRFLHPAFISYLTNSFLSSRRLANIRTRHLYMPSTGALMLLTALHTCDQVSAFGFITQNFADFSDHYYDSRKRPLRFFANHDLRMESRLWEILHRRKVIRLFTRDGGRRS